MTYERSVCLASALSHPLFVGEWACPSRCTEPFHPHNLLKSTSTVSPRTITLASLVKGRWLDGKTQTIALLRFTCNTSAFIFTKLLCRQDGGIALRPPTSQFPQPLQKDIPRFAPSPLPYERSAGFASLRNSGRSTSVIHARPLSKVRCCRPKKFGRLPEGLLYAHQPLHPHNHCKMTIIPRPAPSRLPPLSKGGGLTARHKLLPCCVLIATHPPFLFTKLFCRQDGGIAIPPFASHYPSRFS